MTTLHIEIKANGAAFGKDDEWVRDEEVARILTEYANRIRVGWPGDNGALLDANGNTVGTYAWSDLPNSVPMHTGEDDGGPCCLGVAYGSDHDHDCFANEKE